MPFVIIFFLFALIVPMELSARELSQEEIDARIKADQEREKIRAQRNQKKKTRTIKENFTIAIITLEKETPPALSNLDPILQNEGIFGAQLGIEDNNTTGTLLGQNYQLRQKFVRLNEDPLEAFKAFYDEGIRYFVVSADKDVLLAIADLPEAQETLIFNIRARDDVLRNQSCRPNMLHVIPSRAMLSDALIQFLIRKNWKEYFLIKGPDEGDELFAAALKRSVEKFGAEISDEVTWDKTHDIRRTARSEVPLFTKEARKQGIILVSDEKGEFGEYIIFNTWNPALLVGTQGLTANSWHRTHEQWGAAQMQNRFRRTAKRFMRAIDYAAWVAVRTIGEAITRKGSDFATIKNYILSDKFGIAAYKGVKVSYRPWSGQLRQRILLNVPRALVSVSPQDGYLHPVSPMDTLGFDEQTTQCPTPPSGEQS